MLKSGRSPSGYFSISAFSLGALLVLVTFLVYLPVWRAGFIWDDDTFLWRNPLIQSPDGLWRLWFTTAAPDYFPLTSSTLWLEWRLWGANPLGYHLVNVFLHALSALLLWRVLARLRISGALLAAAIFAVHPVNAESVAWVTERKNTLAMVFYLLSVLLYLCAEDGKNARGWDEGEKMAAPPFSILHPPPSLLYCLSLLSFSGALLSKTAAAPLPVVLLGLAWWQRSRLRLRDLWQVAPFFALAAAAGLVTIWFQSHRAIGASMLDVRNDSFWSRLAVASWAFWFYLYKALVPLHLSFVYPRWQIPASGAWAFLPALLVPAFFALCWCYRRSWGKHVLLALGYFLVMLLPVLGFVNIYFMRYSLVADHWQYFAMIGPIALAAALLAASDAWVTHGRRMEDGKSRMEVPQSSILHPRLAPGHAPLLTLLGGALVLALAVLTWREALTYTNLKTLCTATVARNPSAGLAHNNLGTILLAEGHVDEAIAHFERAIALEPNAADVRSNLGGALLQLGQLEPAILQFREAIRLQPDSALAHNNLGNALSRQGRLDEAIVQLQEAVKFQPTFATARCNLAGALLQAERIDEATPQFQRAIELQPDLADAYLGLGDALLAKGQPEEAVTRLRKAVELQPGSATAHYSLANALTQQGQADEAIVHFQKTLTLQPRFAPAYNGLGSALLQKGQVDQAFAQYRKALSLDPSLAEAHLNLANLLVQTQQTEQAIAEFKSALKLQPNLAAAHSNLANALFSKGQVDEAIAHFQQALKLQPNLAEAQNGLANALLRKGRVAEAVTHYQSAVDAVPNHPYLLNNLAWVLATCPDAAIRNGARAVELARKAAQLSGGKDPILLGTLAAAFAETGKFTQAVATVQRALALATAQTNAPQVATLRARLELYESGSPFRDSELTPH